MSRKGFLMRQLKKITKILGMVMCLSLLALTLSGCSGSEDAKEEVVTYLYYVSTDDSAVVPVEYSVEPISSKGLSDEEYYEKVVRIWIDALSGVPEDVTLKSPIDNGLGINSYTYLSGQLTIDFDETYYQKDGLSEILRRAAIVKTLLQIDGIDGIAFTVAGTPLLDSKQVAIGFMSADTFVSNPGAEINSYETATVQLYFADEDGANLIPTKEKVGYISNISMERMIVERVIAGPLTTSAYPVVDPTLKIINVTTKDGICYVNLDNAFLSKTQKVTDEAIIYSFVNSLTELSNVGKVQFMVDSESEVTFGELYLSEPFERNLDIISNIK